jgi:hypothetical protein
MAEMTPRQIGAYHADQAIKDFAERMAFWTKAGIADAGLEEDREYLAGKVDRFKKWVKTAHRQAERKA